MNDILNQSLKRLIKQINMQIEEYKSTEKDPNTEIQDDRDIIDEIVGNEFMGKTLEAYFKDTNFIEKRAIVKEILQSKYSGSDTIIEWAAEFLLDDVGFRSVEELETFFTGMEELLTDTLREDVIIYDRVGLTKRGTQISIAIIGLITSVVIAMCFVEYSGRLFEQLVVVAVVGAIGVNLGRGVIKSYKAGCKHAEDRIKEIRGEYIDQEESV